MRAFAFAPDVAEATLRLLEAAAVGLQFLSPAERVSIRQLAILIRDLVHPGLPLAFDASRPEGPSFPGLPPHPCLRNFAWTPLEEGLRLTVDWRKDSATLRS
jgi:nucleoside-diphosphate-sugar epimerase